MLMQKIWIMNYDKCNLCNNIWKNDYNVGTENSTCSIVGILNYSSRKPVAWLVHLFNWDALQ